MWLVDLELAVKKVREKFPCSVMEKILPCADGGIAFYTSYFTIIKWFPDGRVEERKTDAWRKENA